MTVVAVVPIFMSAGAAALPTIGAVVASLVAIVFKPREVLHLCRRRPVVAGAWAASIAVVLLAVTWWLTPGAQARATGRLGPTPQVRHDWAKIAEDLIAQERAGKAPTVLESDTPAQGTLIRGRDMSRCSFGGGPSPNGLKMLWSFRPEETMFLAAPVVTGNRIFAAGCQADLGSYTGLLACLDAETGKPIWQVTQLGDEVLAPFFSSPALTQDGKHLVIGQGLHQDRDCSLLCFDAATGKLRWRVKTSLHIESSPAIFGDMAVVGAGAVEGEDGRPTGDPGHVIAVRISDGKQLWRQAVNDPESSCAIDENGIVYIGSGFNGCAVVAIRSESDEQLREKKLDRIAWRAPVTLPVTSAITVVRDLVIAGAGNGNVVQSSQNAQGLVVALDRKTGQVRWQTSFDDGVLGGVAARGGMLICPVRSGEVAALSRDDGKILWRARISGSAAVLASCAFTGQRVYAVSSDGYLAVIDPKDGKVLEKLYLNDQGKPGTGLTISAPQVAGGRVIVGSETGGLRCLVGSRSDQ
jgi:outer membrane protein assembly factor BamB